MSSVTLFLNLDSQLFNKNFTEFQNTWSEYSPSPFSAPPTWFDYLDHLVDEQKQTHPLHYVAASGNADWINFLLQQLTPQQIQILLTQRDCNGKTPADYAIENNHPEIARLLSNDIYPYVKLYDEVITLEAIDVLIMLTKKDQYGLTAIEQCTNATMRYKLLTCLSNALKELEAHTSYDSDDSDDESDKDSDASSMHSSSSTYYNENSLFGYQMKTNHSETRSDLNEDRVFQDSTRNNVKHGSQLLSLTN